MSARTFLTALALPLIAALHACDDGASSTHAPSAAKGATSDAPPFSYLERVDDLIEDGERHFAELYRITRGGENAEAYWSFAGDRLVLQRRESRETTDCDRIYVTTEHGELRRISDGRGVTTCAYFLPGDREVLYASTTREHEICPKMPVAPAGVTRGYMWALHPEYDIYVTDLATNETRAVVTGAGYDAEATVSPLGDRMVFTSTRSGDVELWTSNLDGTGLTQVTDAPGYDGGAFFSHDGRRLVFRATEFPTDEAERAASLEDYRKLLDANLVMPSRMELYTCAVDGSDRRKITELGGANFAPFYTPDDSHILFSSNYDAVDRRGPFFDIFRVPAEGGPHGPDALERITTYDGFDSFPMFSPDGKWLAFSSNRGGSVDGETNVYVARWKD